MTPWTKPVTRLTPARVRDSGKPRQIVVTIHAEFIELRLRGTRRPETVDIAAAYHSAIKARVWREKMDRAKERKAKKEQRRA